MTVINLFIAREIADLPAAKNVVVNVINPGLCVSELRREMTGILPWVLDSLARTAEQGARVIAWGALADTSYVDSVVKFSAHPYQRDQGGLRLGVQRQTVRPASRRRPFVRISSIRANDGVASPSPFSTSPAGLKLQKKLWGEMMAVWTEQVPAVASIVA